jgi:hypothetical protein
MKRFTNSYITIVATTTERFLYEAGGTIRLEGYGCSRYRR